MTTATTTLNALSNEDGGGKWIGDGGKVLPDDGFSSLTLTSPKRGTPTNARYDINNSPLKGDWFFEVSLVHVVQPGSSLSVGIVNPEEMGAGWKTSGMFYNGNLTNGSAALLTSFGPHLKEGDTVGVHVANNNKEVTFFYNGRCLGMGFQLKDDVRNKVYCPCLRVDGSVQISFAVPEHLPASSLEAEKEITEGCEGEWKLLEAINEEGSAVEIPQEGQRDLVLSLRPHDRSKDTYDLSMRVSNVLRTQMTVTEDNDSAAGNYQVQMGLIMSTMMMPPPALQEIEAFLSSSLPKMHLMKANDDDDTLALSGGATSKLFLKFARHHKTFDPLESYKH